VFQIKFNGLSIIITFIKNRQHINLRLNHNLTPVLSRFSNSTFFNYNLLNFSNFFFEFLLNLFTLHNLFVYLKLTTNKKLKFFASEK